METPEQQLAGLSAAQRRLVELWLRREQAETIIAPHSSQIPRRQATGAIPLSFAQQRLWFLHQLEPRSPAYNLRTTVRLVGRLDVAMLARSLNAIVQRHEALRTTFRIADEQPRQVIAPVSHIPMQLIDLGQLPRDEQDAHVQHLARTAAAQSFDLEHGPLLRVRLLRLATDEHVLLLTMHHIISDGWSQGVQLRELIALYASCVDGQPTPLPELPIQYADYACWQRRRVQEPGVTAQLAFWKAHLGPTPPVLDLLTDRPRPARPTDRGAVAYVTFPAAVRDQLKELNRREGVTLFMTLLAAFDLLLYRYTGQTDLVVGSPVAGRNRPELEGLIGLFVNMLALRTNLAGNPPFRSLLQHVRTVALGAYAHQDVPFEQVVEALQLARDWSRHPIFQVMLVLQNVPMPALHGAGLSLIPIEIQTTSAVLDLALYFREWAHEIQLRVEYNTDIFDAATIDHMLGHFQMLLGAIVADPDQRLDALPLLTAAERRQLLEGWNATQTAYPHDSGLAALFEAQAAHRPDAVALVFDRPTTNDQRPTTNDGEPRTKNQEPRADDHITTQNSKLKTQNFSSNTQHPTPNTRHLTYDELNRRANQLAHYLRSLGVGAETLVGLCLERSLELVVGMLGILKAGAAYVPLDPAYPPQRLAFMLDDSQTSVLITTNDQRPTTNDRRPDKETRRQGDKTLQEPRTKNQEPRDCENQEPGTDDELKTQNSNAQRAPETQNRTPSPLHSFTLSQRAIVDLRADWPTIAAAPPSNPACRATPDNLAYVIYTSGSTGQPKGVLGLQRGILNRLYWMWHTYPFAAGEVACHKTSMNFVDAMWELFGPLLHGVPLLLLPDAILQDLHEFVETLARAGVTRLVLVPTLLHALLETYPDLARRVPQVHCWTSSGEALTGALAIRFRALLPHARLLNLYGSSEVAADALWYEMTAPQVRPTVPIGRPIANLQVYLLDRALQLVPVGVPGELYLGGAGLARGYLNRPDLTAERFIPNPFGGVLGVGCWVLEDKAPDTQHPSPNTRLYRTGDLARHLPGGSIEFLGRKDQQVKVRGVRIELGEIENILGQHPAVREALVLARADGPGDTRLVAYIVQGSGVRGQGSDDLAQAALIPDPRSLTPDLRAFLKEKLPDYMVPAAFVMLEALPLTPNGKVDRRALPAPDMSQAARAGTLVAPRTPVEEVLAEMWANMLGLEHVGIHDDFFALGGHSLKAAQLIVRVRDAFHVSLPVRSLFDATTVASLAQLLIAHEAKPGQIEKIASAIKRLKGVSAEDRRKMLEQKRRARGLV